MYRTLYPLLLLALLLTACHEESPLTPAAATPDPLGRAAIDAAVEAHLLTTDTPFEWGAADDHLVWSALAASNYEADLGYRPAGYPRTDETIHEIDVSRGDWAATQHALRAELRAATERHLGRAVTDEELFAAPDAVLPVLGVRILHPAVLAAFRRRPDVRYLEPSNYTAGQVAFRSGSGCTGAPSGSIAAADRVTVSPGAAQSWNYPLMNIPAAWKRSQGAGVGICVIDSGTYPEQGRLNGSFGAGRSLERLGTYRRSWWSSRTDGPDDRCGHGTQMAGIATAPRSGGGASVGVAYRADLVSVRASSDVIINGSREKRGVADAMVAAGRRAGVRIVSMSMGDVFSSGRVKDGVRYAHNRGKLVLCAAGTSLSWTSWYGVIFPASMDETVAVTGIREGSPVRRCHNCHDGSKVDFTVPMQRRGDNDRTMLTLARRGNAPGYVGGSSAATATLAGVAALVWATDPGQDRAGVVDRLRRAADRYPGRDRNFGWGTVDALAAVR